ncbi:integrase arm-type DNA-binding domain-containing protein [Gammaproteobacteria bacterium]|jgi:integrase|nr:integrase arm-type DNA-binding domain-containing protein [Gammaproteobacteria bacterium]
MPKTVKELAEVSIKRLKHTLNAKGEPYKAVHAVGGVSGLYLQCLPPTDSQSSGSRQWLYRAVVGGKRRWIGLGGYPSIPTKNAREAARGLQSAIKSGIDPVSEKKVQIAALKAVQAKEITFERYARDTFIPTEAASYKGTAQVRRLNQLLRDYVFPHIGDMHFEDITKQDIEKILNPLIGAGLSKDSTKKETGSRVRNYVEAIIQRAISDGLRDKANPAIWKNNLAPSYKHLEKIEVQNQRSMQWEELPKFIKALNERNTSPGARPDLDCMLFMILTVSRSQEARLADWDEIDLQKKIWRQPKGKYKSKKLDWDIPLCPTAIKILKAQPNYKRQQGRIFSTLDGGELYSAALSTIPDALGFDAVAHGFRSTFKSYCQEKSVNDEVSELSLKHAETTSTRAAYAKNQLLKPRTKLIKEYEQFAMGAK